LRNENRRGLALFSFRQVSFVLREREVAGTRMIRRREAGELRRSIAGDFASELLRQLRGSECGHGQRRGA
jgi:hypothetical protein